MKLTRCLLTLFCWTILTPGITPAGDPCVSGLNAGQRPGPYAFVICTGPQRGQPFCYICDTAEKPAVIVFARALSAPLGKLVRQVDRTVQQNASAKLAAWVTFLHKDQAALDPQVVAWGKEHAIGTVPLGVFEDEVGPPSYRLAREADVTVVLFVQRKVVANFAFRSGELTDAKIAEVMSKVPNLLPKK